MSGKGQRHALKMHAICHDWKMQLSCLENVIVMTGKRNCCAKKKSFLENINVMSRKCDC